MLHGVTISTTTSPPYRVLASVSASSSPLGSLCARIRLPLLARLLCLGCCAMRRTCQYTLLDHLRGAVAQGAVCRWRAGERSLCTLRLRTRDCCCAIVPCIISDLNLRNANLVRSPVNLIVCVWNMIKPGGYSRCIPSFRRCSNGNEHGHQVVHVLWSEGEIIQATLMIVSNVE